MRKCENGKGNEQASESTPATSSGLTIDRAAFMLLRVKRVFKKKKQQAKHKLSSYHHDAETSTKQSTDGPKTYPVVRVEGKQVPLARSRTLPAIIVPVGILQAQLDSNRAKQASLKCIGKLSFCANKNQPLPKVPAPKLFASPPLTKRNCTSRISFSEGISHSRRCSFNKLAPDDIGRRKSAISRLCLGSDSTPATPEHRAKVETVSESNLHRSASIDSLGNCSRSNSIWDDDQFPEAVSLRKYSQISDSGVDYGFGDGKSAGKRPYQQVLFVSATRSLSLVSPSIGRRVKGQRSLNDTPLNAPMDVPYFIGGGLKIPTSAAAICRAAPLICHANDKEAFKKHASKKETKLMRQQLDKLAKINIHLHALFAAVEHGHLEKARTILESTDVDVNSINCDGLSPLDVAVLSNCRPIIKMLISFGAKEGHQFANVSSLAKHLESMLGDADMRLHELGVNPAEYQSHGPRASISSIMNAYPSSTGCSGSGGDVDKQASVWIRRAKSLQRLILGLNQLTPPNPPTQIHLEVKSLSTVTLNLKIPSGQDVHIITKYKVQWCNKHDFVQLAGEMELTNMRSTCCQINDLNPNVRYYFRVACGNLKGYGPFKLATPASCIPSSWREIDNATCRFAGRLESLDKLFNEIKAARPSDTCELLSLDNVTHARKNQKKKTTIKQLFTAASKFQKHLRRGIYLACILYHDDKVLVTNEDNIPTIEIDETYPSNLNTDFYWLMKISGTWDDVKSMRADMERNSAISAWHFRVKLLSAVQQMQQSLGVSHLGQLYYKPLKDVHGTVVLSLITSVKSPKTISVLNSKWLPLEKVHKKLTALNDDCNVMDILRNSIQHQITYDQVSHARLPPGLYLGYLKLQSSVDAIQVVVPLKTPNILPHCKVRDNAHVSAEEWSYLKNYHHTYKYQQHKRTSSDTCAVTSHKSVTHDFISEQQQHFVEQIRMAVRRVLSYMDITHADDILTHRIYDVEVVEIDADVSFIVLCPSAETACSVPGQRELLLQRDDLLSVPIQVFEMNHLNTYHRAIVQRYARLSCVVELDILLTNHTVREAFSTNELTTARAHSAHLNHLQTKLNQIWKSVRWLMDVIAFTRERHTPNGIMLRDFITDTTVPTCEPCYAANSYLQLPGDEKIGGLKNTPGRGSWPGPNCTLNRISSDFSKSEQQLCADSASLDVSTQYLSVTSDVSRKSSLESYEKDDKGLTASRSESMLSACARHPVLLTVNKKPVCSGSLHCVDDKKMQSSTISVLLSPPKTKSKMRGRLTSTPSKRLNQSFSMLSVNDDNESARRFLCTHDAPNLSKSLTNICRINEDDEYDAFRKPFVASATGRVKDASLKDASSRDTRGSSMFCMGLTNKSPKAYLNKSLMNLNELVIKECDLIATPRNNPSTSQTPASDSSIIQVFAAYDTGLASGTSLKLHVTPRTTAREVVDLVVKQLNMAIILSGKDGPVYNADVLRNFCLVAVIGARERCLRDDFKPLQLQNPWRKGKLYVRQKQDVLAALDYSTRQTDLI